MTNYHDWAGRALSSGDLVLDDRGLPWRIKDFRYGRENVAVCEGVGYNKRQQAVRVGETLRIEVIPADAKDGRVLFQRLFDVLGVGRILRKKVRERRQQFQDELAKRK